MGRAPRIEFPGAIYHAMSRGVNRRSTFRDDFDRRLFLSLLGKIVAKGALIVHAFCLMTNHFHLLAETPFGELNRWMQKLLGPYAQRFNLAYQRVGHLWQGRYKAILVEDGEYFLECSRYIHLNPPVRPAEQWPWSSYGAYVGGQCPVDWVSTKKTLFGFANRKEYRRFVESISEENLTSPFKRASAGLALGSDAFIESIMQRIDSTSHLEAERVLRSLARRHPAFRFSRIQEAVEAVFADWSPCQRRRLHAFALRSLTHAKIADVARTTGLSASAVSHATRSIRERCLLQPDLQQKILILRDILTRT